MQGIGNFPFHAKLDMFASHIRISSSFRWKPPRPKQSIRSFRVRRGWVSGSRLPVSSTYNTYLGFKGIGSPSLSSDTAHSCPHNTHGRSEQLALVSFRINTICINDLHLAQRGGSGWLDSLGHSLSGAWRVADYAAVSRVVRLSEYTWSGVWPSSA